jgi:hypothetical protein
MKYKTEANESLPARVAAETYSALDRHRLAIQNNVTNFGDGNAHKSMPTRYASIPSKP